MGFREDLAYRCCFIAEDLFEQVKHPHQKQPPQFTTQDGAAMRELWECAKTGNLVLDMLSGVGAAIRTAYLHALFSMPGFLTGAEKRATKAVQDSSILVYRGARRPEHKTGKYGLSWTADEAVARWFAARNQGQSHHSVLIQGVVDGRNCYVLDTCESEVVVFGQVDVQAVTQCDWQVQKMDWDNMRAVPVVRVQAKRAA